MLIEGKLIKLVKEIILTFSIIFILQVVLLIRYSVFGGAKINILIKDILT